MNINKIMQHKHNVFKLNNSHLIENKIQKSNNFGFQYKPVQNSIYMNMKSYSDLRSFGTNILNLDMNDTNNKIVRILWCDFEEVMSSRFHKKINNKI